jgi:hypothetical protein
VYSSRVGNTVHIVQSVRSCLQQDTHDGARRNTREKRTTVVSRVCEMPFLRFGATFSTLSVLLVCIGKIGRQSIN